MLNQTDPQDPLEKPVPVKEPAVPQTPQEEPPSASPKKLEPHKPMIDNKKAPFLAKEIGGQKGPEPTRYGDWESKGRCTDF